MNCGIGSITISDHAPITLSVDLGKEFYFTYWRLNESILSDEKIVKEPKQNLKDYFLINGNDELSPSTLWEGGKAIIRGKIIEITSGLRKAHLENMVF